MFSITFVCLSTTFEPLHIENSFLACRYTFLDISGSSLSIKVIVSKSRSYEENDNFTYFNMLILCMRLQVITNVKVIHQCEGHIKVKVKISTFFRFYAAYTVSKWVLCIHLKCLLVFVFISDHKVV